MQLEVNSVMGESGMNAYERLVAEYLQLKGYTFTSNVRFRGKKERYWRDIDIIGSRGKNHIVGEVKAHVSESQMKNLISETHRKLELASVKDVLKQMDIQNYEKQIFCWCPSKASKLSNWRKHAEKYGIKIVTYVDIIRFMLETLRESYWTEDRWRYEKEHSFLMFLQILVDASYRKHVDLKTVVKEWRTRKD